MKPTLPGRQKEINVCGWQSVSMLFAKHPGEVRRLYFDQATGRRAGEFCSQLAQQKKVYRQLSPEELEKAAGTVHHGGIVAVIGERPMKKVTSEVLATWGRTKAPLLLLDRVSNANNVGAIVRTAAFFGVNTLIVADHPAQAMPGEAAWRVAEGGMEFVDFYRVPALPELCGALKRSHFLIGTSLTGQQLSRAVPLAGDLEPLDLSEVHGRHQDPRGVQAADHAEGGLVAVQPGQEGDTGLVVEGGRGEHLPGQRLGGAEDAVVPGGVAGVEGLDGR